MKTAEYQVQAVCLGKLLAGVENWPADGQRLEAAPRSAAAVTRRAMASRLALTSGVLRI
jgi:hypothetical protein